MSPPRCKRPVGRLLMIVKSAHVYETEIAYMRDILAETVER